MAISSITNRRLFAIFLIFAAFCCKSQAQDTTATENAGNALQILLPASAYTATLIVGDTEGRKQFYKSFAATLVVTYALKYAINKDRPEGNGGLAFPSGHTSVSFQSAAFINRRYGLKYAIPAYAAATYVGWSRAEEDRHDWSDVAAGAAVGVISSYYFTRPYHGFTVTPAAGDHAVGINISKEW